MSRQAPRLHRLPKRTDYILIPPPLDLSLPLVDEKSPLPAIIVTPSSPSSSRDFAIAFLADPPKPTLRERLVGAWNSWMPFSSSSSPSMTTTGTTGPIALGTGPILTASAPVVGVAATAAASKRRRALAPPNLRIRSIMLILFVLFILACHLVTHRFATTSSSGPVRGPFFDGDADMVEGADRGNGGERGWFGLFGMFGKGVGGHPDVEGVRLRPVDYASAPGPESASSLDSDDDDDDVDMGFVFRPEEEEDAIDFDSEFESESESESSS